MQPTKAALARNAPKQPEKAMESKFFAKTVKNRLTGHNVSGKYNVKTLHGRYTYN